MESLADIWEDGKPVGVFGGQWGDEGKGRLVDFLTAQAEFVIRFNGGANAGHTIIVGDKKEVTHLLPSGIIRRGTKNVVGPGVLCTLAVLRHEATAIADLCGAEVLLDRSAPVVHAIHRWFDAAREAGGQGIGTTKRGIGPACEDIASRRGSVRLGDLTDVDRVREILTRNNYYNERRCAAEAFCGRAGLEPFPTLEEVIADIMAYKGDVVPRLCDARAIIARAVKQRKKVLFEAAQAILLDPFAGTAPHTTSSLCTRAGVGATFGIYDFGAVIGVAKAYATRVGDGPFPTELEDATGDRLRELGHEYGSTTGRPRRCGWLDLVALRYAARMGGLTHLAITKLDTLAAFDEVKVCTGYTFNGRPVEAEETLTSKVMRDSVQSYLRLPGWGRHAERLPNCRRLADLPEDVRTYLERIETETGCPVIAAGVGPEREQLAI